MRMDCSSIYRQTNSSFRLLCSFEVFAIVPVGSGFISIQIDGRLRESPDNRVLSSKHKERKSH